MREEKYIVYRIRNSFFAEALYAHKFIVMVLMSNTPIENQTLHLNIRRSEPTKERLLRFVPSYRWVQFNYYLVNKKSYDNILKMNRDFGWYKSNMNYDIQTNITDDMIDYPTDKIRIRNFTDYIHKRNVYDIKNNNINYNTEKYLTYPEIADALHDELIYLSEEGETDD